MALLWQKGKKSEPKADKPEKKDAKKAAPKAVAVKKADSKAEKRGTQQLLNEFRGLSKTAGKAVKTEGDVEAEVAKPAELPADVKLLAEIRDQMTLLNKALVGRSPS